MVTGSKEETLELLMKTNFPESSALNEEREKQEELINTRPPTKRLLSLSARIFTKEKVKWAINSFKPYKSPGGDGIFPGLLQKGLEILLPLLTKLFRASYALGYVPQLWRDVKVAFIPKGGGRPESQPKSYRPISLTSFLLKSMEKVLDFHIRSEILNNSPLHSQQFAYQPGKSTITALQSLVGTIEQTFEAKKIALCAFLDIEGAFDNTSYRSIERATIRKGVEPSTVKWIRGMLECRRITAELGGKSISIKATRGCPQGGVLSPLLWSMVVDDLLRKLEESRIDAQGYADDVVIIVKGINQRAISRLLQNALNMYNGGMVPGGKSQNKPRQNNHCTIHKEKEANACSAHPP